MCDVMLAMERSYYCLSQLASFPGYDPDHLTRLPHGLMPLLQMKRVTRAQTKLASKVHTHTAGYIAATLADKVLGI